jgi:peptidoglycan biosynthesis protein MviN/MurJ (putative lipid II flippase)
MTDSRFQLIQSLAGVGLLSFLSPVTGFLVEVCLARIGGASAPVDAYRATSIVLNMGMQVFFGAATIQVLVPLLCELNLSDHRRVGWRTAILFGLMLTALILPVG